VLFGPREAKIYDQLDTLVISSPSPRDATATTLVGRTRLSRSALRDFLGKTTPIKWTTARGGLLGRRSGNVFPGDKRVFLSPFKSWFVLAQPSDVPGLAAAAPGDPDTVEATVKLPAWLAGIRKIESESGKDAGPALVVTIDTGGKTQDLSDYELILGIKAVPMPQRISLALTIDPQGWTVRGNMRFARDADAQGFVDAATAVKQRVGGVQLFEKMIGAAAVHVVQKLQLARTGPRVSYTTAISIADTRALLAVAAQYLDAYYGAP
jgi:hypothetical protein